MIAFLIIVVLVIVVHMVAFYHGYRKGYTFARSLGGNKIPPFNKLHEELP